MPSTWLMHKFVGHWSCPGCPCTMLHKSGCLLAVLESDVPLVISRPVMLQFCSNLHKLPNDSKQPVANLCAPPYAQLHCFPLARTGVCSIMTAKTCPMVPLMCSWHSHATLTHKPLRLHVFSQQSAFHVLQQLQRAFQHPEQLCCCAVRWKKCNLVKSALMSRGTSRASSLRSSLKSPKTGVLPPWYAVH